MLLATGISPRPSENTGVNEMVWIDNDMILRQHIADTIEARSMAIAYLENHPNEYKVFFYKAKNSRKDYAYVFKVKHSGTVSFYWMRYDNKVGVVQTPLYKNGKLKMARKTTTSKPKNDFTKVSAAGIPIYKIWYSPLMDSYDVLGRSKSGEWVYGRDYDLKDGVWQGGRYDYDIDNLYKRVGGTYPKVYKNNHRGPTGKF